MPGYTAAQAVRTLAALRERTARLEPLDPAAVAGCAKAAGVAAGAVRAALVLSGRTTYDDMRGDRPYVAKDMARRMLLLAEALGGPRTWAGVTDRALWTGLVAQWSGLEVGDDRPAGLVRLAPAVVGLRALNPLPGADPAPPALRLVAPVTVAAVQRALRWSVVAAVALLRPDVVPAEIDAALPVAAGPVLPAVEDAARELSLVEPALPAPHEALRRAEEGLVEELRATKQAGGHMDVRPDEDVVASLLWQAESSAAAIAVLCRRLLADARGPLFPLARDATDVLTMVAARGGSWPDEATTALRRFADLALVVTARCVTPRETPSR